MIIDEVIIDKLLYSFKKCKVSLVSQKLTLSTMKVSTDSWEKLPHTKKDQLTDTAQNFFHLLSEFSKLKKNKRNELVDMKTIQVQQRKLLKQLLIWQKAMQK